MTTKEEWWGSVLKAGSMWVAHTSSTRVCISIQGWQEAKIDWGKEPYNMMLVKKDMLRYVQEVRAVRGMGRGLLDHHVVLSKVTLVGAWIKRREVVDRARKIRSKKLRKHQYREGYARSLEGKRVELDVENKVEQIWKKVQEKYSS